MILHLRSIFISLGELAYFVWVQPIMLASLRQTREHPDPLLGLALALIQVLNLFAILYKAPFVQERLARHTPGNASQISPGVGIFVTFVMVMCYVGLVSPLASWATLQAFGIDIRGELSLFKGLLGFAYLFCMFVLNAGLMPMALFPWMGQIHRPAWLRIGEKYPMTVEWLADITLAVFSVTTYTIIWEGLAASTPFQARTPQSAVMEYFGAVVFFCMIYPAANALTTAEEWMSHRPLWARILSGVIFLVIMATAIGNLPNAK